MSSLVKNLWKGKKQSKGENKNMWEKKNWFCTKDNLLKEIGHHLEF